MMFTRKKDSDGEYRLTNRFWFVVAIATILIGVIGWRTQDTADKVQAQAAYNTQVAEQTNDCLNQLLATLKERVSFNDEVSDLRSKRDDIWMSFIVALAAIPTDQPQAERDAQAKPVIDKFFSANKALDQARADALANRNEVPYPPENCGEVKPTR